MRRTLLGDVQPDGVVAKGVLIGIEALQALLAAIAVAIHGGILLVAEDEARIEDAFAIGLGAWPADGLPFVAFQLSQAARLAGAWAVS